jgi:hypothetical protein
MSTRFMSRMVALAQRQGMRRSLGWPASLLWALLSAGCVQEVTIIEAGAGGAGGSEPTLPPATIEDVRASCTALCNGNSCELWPHFCETECSSIVVDECYAEANAILQCLLAAPAGECNLSSAICRQEVFALYDCQAGDECKTGTCVPGGGCSCSGLCGPNILTQECIQDDPDHATCTCYYGDTAIATCEETTASCNMAACCGTLLI